MKSNQKLTLLFWHRKSKADGNGNTTVVCRISIQNDYSIWNKKPEVFFSLNKNITGKTGSCKSAHRGLSHFFSSTSLFSGYRSS